MRHPSLAVLASVLAATSAWAYDQPMVYDLKPRERVLVPGDSTTYDGTFVAGYVRLVDQAIQEQAPDMKAAVRSFAWPGVTLVPERPEKRRPFAEQWKAAMNVRTLPPR